MAKLSILARPKNRIYESSVRHFTWTRPAPQGNRLGMEENYIPYMGNHWLSIEDGFITLGITEEGLEEVEEVVAIDLPAENEEVTADEICGELDSRDGPLNIYSPVTGSVVELNHAVIDTPELVREDPYGEGWLMRIEADDDNDLQKLQADHNSDDEE